MNEFQPPLLTLGLEPFKPCPVERGISALLLEPTVGAEYKPALKGSSSAVSLKCSKSQAGAVHEPRSVELEGAGRERKEGQALRECFFRILAVLAVMWTENDGTLLWEAPLQPPWAEVLIGIIQNQWLFFFWQGAAAPVRPTWVLKAWCFG